MGTTAMHLGPGQSARAVIVREATSNGHRVVDVQQVGSIFYLACEVIPKDKRRKPYIYGLVAKTERRRKDHHNFAYKFMDESMHPFFYDCPVRILDQLSPVNKIYEASESGSRMAQSALAWREKCRAKAGKELPKAGDVVKFAEPLQFNKGYGERQSLAYVERNTFTDGITRFSIPGWKDRDFIITRRAANAA